MIGRANPVGSLTCPDRAADADPIPYSLYPGPWSLFPAFGPHSLHLVIQITVSTNSPIFGV